MLDLTAAAAQVAARARELGEWEATFATRRDQALACLREAAGAECVSLPPEVARWIAVPEVGPIDQRTSSGAPPARSTVLAVDGSQIEPDFHEMVSCCLTNVGWAVFRYGGGPERGAEMSSHPEVRIGDDAIDGAPGAPDPAVPESGSRRTEVTRMLAEVNQLRQLIEEASEHGEAVALVDGPLVAYWVLNLLSEPERRAAMSAYEALFDTARQRGAALAGYISRTRSGDIMHLLRYRCCAEVRAGGGLCAACAAGFPRGQRACYAGIKGIVDRNLFEALLQPGERSGSFRSAGVGVEPLESLGHGLRFFYLRSTDDLARIECPAWVTADERLVSRLQAVLLDQITLGHGYPLALCEAHEQAVVRGPDRTAFYEIVRRCCWRGGYYPELSSKLRSKRQPVG